MSLVPHKRKERDKTEDVELLKLVGAVLESSGGKTRGPNLAQRLRRFRIAVERKVQKHPFIAFGSLFGLLIFAFVVGATSTASALREKEATTSSRGGGGGSGSYGSSSSRRRNATPSSSGRTVGAGGAGRVVNSELGREDLARDLIERVVEGGYEERSDVATGRFLRDFENQWLLLVDVDRSQLQPARRAKRWLQVRGPYRISEARAKAELTRGSVPYKEAREAIIRVVEDDDDEVWKLEHIRVY